MELPPPRLQQALLPSERLQWWGRPDPKALFTPIDLFLVPFSLFWCGFAVFWEVSVLTTDTPGFFPVFGLFFVVIGLYLVIGRFVAKRIMKRDTLYAITDRRVLVLSGRGSMEEPVRSTGMRIEESTFLGRRSVRFGSSPSFLPFLGGQAEFYANTGLDVLGMGKSSSVRFFDVVDHAELGSALRTLRTRTLA
jgi:hypothetical protein